MVKSFWVTHYQHLVDKLKYRNNPDSFYKTRVHEHKTAHGTALHNVQVRYSELDQSVNPDWRERNLVELTQDGNGLTLNLTDRTDAPVREVYLNYSQALELHLALVKWHQINRTGMMRQVKIKR